MSQHLEYSLNTLIKELNLTQSKLLCLEGYYLTKEIFYNYKKLFRRAEIINFMGVLKIPLEYHIIKLEFGKQKKSICLLENH